uniref:RTM1 protein n=1 Tax=Solanum tuberosum TaxID=4113 RepID=M1DMM4_SOLTU
MNMDMIKVGPIGGKTTDGSVWDEKGKGEIAKIFVTSGIEANFVLSLQFLFVDHNGQFILSDRHGAHYNSSLTTTFNTVVLDYPSEFLIGIKGTYYSNGMRSITFVSNKGTYGPYGGVKPMVVDREFDFQIGNDRSFGGFHGLKQKAYVESIGLYLKPITPSMIQAHSTHRAQPKRKKNK